MECYNHVRGWEGSADWDANSNQKEEVEMDDVIGQPLRKLHGNSTRQALFWNPKGKEGKQGLKNNWRKSAKQELQQIGSQ